MKTKKSLFKAVEPYLYLLSAFALMFLFVYYPFGISIFKSFFLMNSMGTIREFIGFENYRYLFKNPTFIKAIGNTLKFTVFAVPLSVGVGFILAVAASKKRKLSPLYETLFSLPMAMSASVSAMIFELMFNPMLGIINRVMNLDINWLQDIRTAMWVLIIIRVWMNIGFNYLFLLSAIRGLPEDILESAEVEGANTVQKAARIVLPLVSPTVFFLICNSLAKAMTMSGLSLILTSNGGPSMSTETMISFMYKAAADSQNYNIAYPAAIVAFGITMVAVVLTFIYEKRGVFYN